MGTRHLALFALFLAACSPTLRDDVYACTTTSECPTGFQCIGERCRNTTGTDCPTGRDSECFDGSDCTRDTCETGFCVHVAEPEAEGVPCEDGIFCNGPNTCRDGACEASGVAPCAICDEGSMGCLECGREGMACCDGGLCADGVCDGTTCQPCGGIGESCCANSTCDFGGSCDYGGTEQCVTCGGSGEACCLDFSASAAICNAPGETCDFRGVLPICAICGHLGEPACPNGCLEGIPDAGVCTQNDCGAECPEGSVCALNPEGSPADPPVCFPCGLENSFCCPGQVLCTGADGSPIECYYGYCAGGGMVLPEP